MQAMLDSEETHGDVTSLSALRTIRNMTAQVIRSWVSSSPGCRRRAA